MVKSVLGSLQGRFANGPATVTAHASDQSLNSNGTENVSAKRVAGLDSLRFILALWVVFGHFGFLPLSVDKNYLPAKLTIGIYNNLFAGPAAVIVFFVISGFCIHYPHRSGARPRLAAYFTRRYVRIVFPVLAAIALAGPLQVRLPMFKDSILWSLVCEEVYYAIYPLLLICRSRTGWVRMIVAAYVAALCVILTNPGAGDYPSFGLRLNWLLGLPCWLLGCQLAEIVDAKVIHPSTRTIWTWRMSAWFLSWLCSALRFHSPVKYPWTLDVFAIFAFCWLGQEIAYYRVHRPASALERAGKWSYSMYLTHGLATRTFFLAYIALGAWGLPQSPGPRIIWVMMISFILAFCFCFYLVVERPSHLFARFLGDSLLRSAKSTKEARGHEGVANLRPGNMWAKLVTSSGMHPTASTPSSVVSENSGEA